MWRQLKPQGRFLARYAKYNELEIFEEASYLKWYDVGDKKAREKTSQCLREVLTPDILHLMHHRLSDKKIQRKTPQKSLSVPPAKHLLFHNEVAKNLGMLAVPQHAAQFDSRRFLPAMKQNMSPHNLGQIMPQSLICLQFSPFVINQMNEAMDISNLQRNIRRQQIILMQQSLLQAVKQQH